MGQVAAKQGDRVVSTDIHIEIIPGTPPAPTPIPNPFNGIIDGGVSQDVLINGKPAATKGSTATNTPPHRLQAGTSFLNPPLNQGSIETGSTTVMINGRPAARNGDKATTCNDQPAQFTGTVIAIGSVMIG